MPASAWFEERPSNGEFSDVVARKKKTCECTESSSDSDTSEESEPESVPTNAEGQSLFTCSEEGCGKVFLRYAAFSAHLQVGIHKKKLERKTLSDRAKHGYAQRLEGMYNKKIPLVEGETESHIEKKASQEQLRRQGWALRQQAKGKTRFNDRQKKFLVDKYEEGESTGTKYKPEELSREMRILRDGQNRRVFTVAEFLTPQQIQSFFSRLTAKRRQMQPSEVEDMERRDALDALQRQLAGDLTPHPISFGDLNLCSLGKAGIDKLKMAQLRVISKHFSLNIKSRRKEDFVQAILTITNSCCCKN